MSEKKTAITLKTSSDVRKFLSRIVNEVYAGELDAPTGSKLGYLLNITLEAIRMEDTGGHSDEEMKILFQASAKYMREHI